MNFENLMILFIIFRHIISGMFMLYFGSLKSFVEMNYK